MRTDDECYTGSGPASEVMQCNGWGEPSFSDVAANVPAAHLRPGSPEVSAMIDSVLAEYGWPANPKNAARAGFVACQRLMAQPGPDWATLGPPMLEMLALAVRQIDGSTTADGRALQEVGWVRHARALITKAKEGGA